MAKEKIMTKRIPAILLLSAALALGVSLQASAQDGDSQNAAQQQSEQQHAPNSDSQSSGDQAGGSGSSDAAAQDQDTQQQESDSGSESGNGQGADQSGDAAEQEQKENQDQFITAQKSSQVLASSLMGLSIQNGTGQDASEIGTVSDLIMDEQHKLVGIVVGIGGFLGIGQKSVGIPWEVVENLDPEKGVAVVSLSKEQLQNAPPFKSQQEQQQEQQQQQ